MNKAQLRAELDRVKTAQRIELGELTKYNFNVIKALKDRQRRELDNQKANNRINVNTMKARHKSTIENLKAQIRDAKN
jgi:hypothetical protein